MYALHAHNFDVACLHTFSVSSKSRWWATPRSCATREVLYKVVPGSCDWLITCGSTCKATGSIAVAAAAVSRIPRFKIQLSKKSRTNQKAGLKCRNSQKETLGDAAVVVWVRCNKWVKR